MISILCLQAIWKQIYMSASALKDNKWSTIAVLSKPGAYEYKPITYEKKHLLWRKKTSDDITQNLNSHFLPHIFSRKQNTFMTFGNTEMCILWRGVVLDMSLSKQEINMCLSREMLHLYSRDVLLRFTVLPGFTTIV